MDNLYGGVRHEAVQQLGPTAAQLRNNPRLADIQPAHMMVPSKEWRGKKNLGSGRATYTGASGSKRPPKPPPAYTRATRTLGKQRKRQQYERALQKYNEDHHRSVGHDPASYVPAGPDSLEATTIAGEFRAQDALAEENRQSHFSDWAKTPGIHGSRLEMPVAAMDMIHRAGRFGVNTAAGLGMGAIKNYMGYGADQTDADADQTGTGRQRQLRFVGPFAAPMLI